MSIPDVESMAANSALENVAEPAGLSTGATPDASEGTPGVADGVAEGVAEPSPAAGLGLAGVARSFGISNVPDASPPPASSTLEALFAIFLSAGVANAGLSFAPARAAASFASYGSTNPAPTPPRDDEESHPMKWHVNAGGSTPDRISFTGHSGSLPSRSAHAATYAAASVLASTRSFSFAPRPHHRNTSFVTSSSMTSSSQRSSCVKLKISSHATPAPPTTASQIWKSLGSCGASYPSPNSAYGFLPPMCAQKMSGSAPSSITSTSAWESSPTAGAKTSAAIVSAQTFSSSEDPRPFHANTLALPSIPAAATF
mmetsp:Transcript_11949/g.46345  ORF Transcript_11949/g.46345 Transcript_11949/m.46345 type:complete len:314 (-) Transcript_11949:1696-2637(-)